MSGPREIRPRHLIRLRLGHGANCSSLGSVIDTLFGTAAAGAALFAAVVAALQTEPIVVAPRPKRGRTDAGAQTPSPERPETPSPERPAGPS